ncbi:hypothetical protein SAMN05216486_1229 [bacterium JGI 053]|nr:hypothetical protein SAMN05216486_1229 [bacterium JGI 053]
MSGRAQLSLCGRTPASASFPSSPAIEDIVQFNRPKVTRRPWVTPVVADLPRLTDLTLTTGAPIPGSGDTGGGSTVTP